MGLEAFTAPYSVHLGCNTMKFPGFINMDVRQTEATDIVHDCSDLSIFPDDSVLALFSHAFFEHLYREQRAPLLAEIRRVLQPMGWVFFAGIPDFEVIAKKYLEHAQGNVSPSFNLYEVYRYTHGDPEQHPEWWQAQLHKTLFDQNELRALLWQAGFTAPCIFRYAYHSEPNPVNLGFIANKSNLPIPDDFMHNVFSMFSPIYGDNPITKLS